MRKTSGMAKSSLVWLLVAALLFVAPAGAAANAKVIQANLYKAFHDTYDENDPDQKFSGALDLQFYNMELDIMVDANHSTYTGPQYPDYLQGKVRLYVKHDAAAQPNTRDLYKYLEDVAARIAANGDSVYGDGRDIIINLDMKTANNPDYREVSRSLQAILDHYPSLISYGYVGEPGSFTEQAITVCLSGSDGLKDAYFAFISETTGKLSAFKDQVHSVTGSRHAQVSDYFPREADIYHRFYAIHWKHIESGFDLLMPGNWSQEEEQRLEAMMRDATQKGYTLRFYSLNGAVGAWHYKFPNGDGDAAQRWTQFAAVNHKLGTRHYVSTDSYEAITRLYDRFLVPIRHYNGRVEKSGGTQNGTDVSVSITDDKRVVEIHKAEGAFNNNLWYSVGAIQENGYVEWLTNNRINPGGSNKNGIQPHSDVTTVDGRIFVVQVNQTDGTGNGLWANIGTLQSDSTIHWMTNERITMNGSHTGGSWPHIALDGDRVVLVYLNGGQLRYQTGLLDAAADRINWLHAGTVDGQNGERPDVAMQDGRIVAVYRSSSKLQYTTGTWGTGGALSWQFTGQMQGQDGTDPTVAFVGEDKIIEMHTSQNTGLIWYNIGELHWPSVNWVHNHIWDSGVSSKPSVDYHAGHHILIDVHKAGLNDALWYNSGRVHFP